VTSLLDSQTTFFSSAQIPVMALNLFEAGFTTAVLLVMGKAPPVKTQTILLLYGVYAYGNWDKTSLTQAATGHSSYF
jgi:hypothetical protein